MKLKYEQKIFVWLFLLIFTSGYLNAASLVIYTRAVSHHTGNITNLAIYLLTNRPDTALSLLVIMAAFFLGGVLSGFIFHEQPASSSKKFGIKLILDAAVLLLIHLLMKDLFMRYIIISFILGSQNAFLFKYRGLTTRITHLTGYITDAAVFLGRRIRGNREDMPRFWFLTFQTLGFLVGAGVGCLLVRLDRILYLTLPAALYALAGFFYLIYIYRKDGAGESPFVQ